MSDLEDRILVGRKVAPNTISDAVDIVGSDAFSAEAEKLSKSLQAFVPINEQGNIFCTKYPINIAWLLVAFRHPEYAKNFGIDELVKKAERYAVVLDCVQSDCADAQLLPEGPGSFHHPNTPWEYVPYDGKYAFVLIYDLGSRKYAPMARLSFSPWNGKGILVFQNQGVRGQAGYLNQFICHYALFAITCDWAKRNNLPSIGIISHKSSRNDKVRENDALWRFYGGVAQQFGLEELTADLEHMKAATIYCTETEKFAFNSKLGVWIPAAALPQG